MARFDVVTLGGQEEHLQGVLIGQGVPPNECQHFTSFEIVMAKASNQSPAKLIQDLLISLCPSDIAEYAHEVDGYMKKFSVKGALQRLLQDQDFNEAGSSPVQ